MEAEIGNACGGSPTPPSPPSPPSGPSGEECTASAPKDKSCCNKKAEKCGENEGDCDKDSHCKSGLKCGNDNCPSGFPSNYDCCYNPSPSGPPSGPSGEECTASASKDKSCCNKKAEKCGVNEGDCDKDSHCKTGLKCGSDNCPSGFPSNYDCCYNPSPSGPPSEPKPEPCRETCGSPSYKGDNYCEDNNNNCGCEYDGGDCCGPKVNKTYCKACECKGEKPR